MISRMVHTGTIEHWPQHTNEMIYMEPFHQRLGLPPTLRRWQPVVDEMLANVVAAGPAYLMVHQGTVEKGDSLRRPGPHVDGNWNADGSYHGDPPLPPGHTNPSPRPPQHRNPILANELVILASDVYGCDALLGEYTGTFGPGGDCAGMDLSRLARFQLSARGVYVGDVYTVHEAVPSPVTCHRTVVRINVPKATLHLESLDLSGQRMLSGKLD